MSFYVTQIIYPSLSSMISAIHDKGEGFHEAYRQIIIQLIVLIQNKSRVESQSPLIFVLFLIF